MRNKTFAVLALGLTFACAPISINADSYYERQAKEYTRKAEYYQRQADGYKRDADYYQRQAKSHIRDVEYYTEKGDPDRAKTYLRKAESALTSYSSKLRQYESAHKSASDYSKRASEALRR